MKQKQDKEFTNYLKSAMCSYFSVEDIDGEPPARDPEDGRVIKEAGEAFGVQSGAGHQHFQVRSEPGDVLNQTKQDVCVERSLVGLIYDDHTGGRGRQRVWGEGTIEHSTYSNTYRC